MYLLSLEHPVDCSWYVSMYMYPLSLEHPVDCSEYISMYIPLSLGKILAINMLEGILILLFMKYVAFIFILIYSYILG